MTTRKIITIAITVLLAALAVAWCAFAATALLGGAAVTPTAAYWAGASTDANSVKSTDTLSVASVDTLKYLEYTFSYTANGDHTATSSQIRANTFTQASATYAESAVGVLTCTADMSILTGDTDEVKTAKSRYIGLTLPAVVIRDNVEISMSIAVDNLLTVTGIKDSFNATKLVLPEVVPVLIANAGTGTADAMFKLYLFENVKVESAAFNAAATALQNVETLIIPSNVTAISAGDGMFFSGMPNLKSVTFNVQNRTAALTIDAFCFIDNTAAKYYSDANNDEYANIAELTAATAMVNIV